MKEVEQKISYRELEEVTELPPHLQQLLSKAKEAISNAYAPYSNFKVGAAALLADGTIVSGSNQENASSPVGICAERVTLSAVSAAHPNVAVTAIAISAKGKDMEVSEPVAPCGLCRQAILEYEKRFNTSIELILQGERGKIFWISSVKDLLPLYFSRNDLNK
jgi:cytidine deaminase